MYYALIMAGGIGTRLWPQSRRNHPKQLLTLVGGRSMFEHATGRLAPLFTPEQIYVVVREDLVTALNAQVPELPVQNFIVEPQGRGTAPAIGLGALHLYRQDPNAVMVVLTADHFIADTVQFRRVLSAAAHMAEAGHLVTLGITPTFPATGYGYIHQGENIETVDTFPVFRVARFTEKPDLETATRMVMSGEYAWNSGMFVWRVDRILEEFRRQMPEFHAQLMTVADALGTLDYDVVLNHIWPQVARQTIDYGVMEGAEDVVVIPADIGWSDVGSWTSMFDLLASDEAGNVVVGPHVGRDTRGSLIVGDRRLIATLGLDDVIIVDTEDALLVCAKSHEQDVREIVEQLEKGGRRDLT